MKNKIFLILYYIIFFIITGIIISLISFNTLNKYTYFGNNTMVIKPLNISLFIISFIAFLITNIFILRKKINIDIKHIIFEISFIIFMLIIVICCLIFDKKLVIEKIEYSYYLTILLIPYILLNIYPIFTLKKKEK